MCSVKWIRTVALPAGFSFGEIIYIGREKPWPKLDKCLCTSYTVGTWYRISFTNVLF